MGQLPDRVPEGLVDQVHLDPEQFEWPVELEGVVVVVDPLPVVLDRLESELPPLDVGQRFRIPERDVANQVLDRPVTADNAFLAAGGINLVENPKPGGPGDVERPKPLV